MKKRLSLLIPLILAIVSIVSSALVFLQEDRRNKREIERLEMREVGLQMGELQNILYNRLTEGDEEEALLSLSLAAMRPGTRTLLLADSQNRVMMSNRFRWKGAPATDHSAYSNVDAFVVAQSGVRKIMFNQKEPSLLQGYFPLVVEYQRGGLAKKMGVLYVESDISPHLKEARNASIKQSLMYGGISLAASLLIAIILHFLVSRRVRVLAEASVRLGAGDYSVQTRLRGDDELAELGKTFDSMAQNVSENISLREKAQTELRIAAVAFETQEAILVTDKDANIVRVNHAFEEITGYSQEEVLGRNPRLLASGRHDKAFYAQMWDAINREGRWSGEVWDRRKDGGIYPKWLTITAVKNQGEVTHYVAVFVDMSERKKAEEEIRHLAFYDALTQLPNRRLMLDRLNSALMQSARSGNHGALMFLDLDHFKVLNDTKGHEYGDRMLVQVAQRLLACVRETDSVARFGGDEFVVLLEGLSNNQIEAIGQAGHIAEKIRDAMFEPYQLGDTVHQSSSSIGVVLFNGEAVGTEELLKHADLAMYQAKEGGRNTVRFFESSMQAVLESRTLLENALRQALPNGELELFYQLQTNESNELLGAEVLLRWHSATLGMVPPAEFIPLAEKTKLILPIGRWVLETACKQLKDWESHPVLGRVRLAVNVSPVQFHQTDFVRQVKAILARTGADPRLLELELTENLVLEDVDEAARKMEALRKIGVRFSMDDFGTGYSSLQYIKRLPIDLLKIDRSFVRDILTDPGDAVMVQTISGMARNFGFNVIAEGVEAHDQLPSLIERGCNQFQGYLFSKPVPLDEFEKLVCEWKSGPAQA